jgi:hypothetical protein
MKSARRESDVGESSDLPDEPARARALVAEHRWPTGDDGQPVSLERALELLHALDAAETYWVEFSPTDDPEIDAELTRIEGRYHSLEAIQRYCEHYSVGAVYGDRGAPSGAVTRTGTLVPGAANPRDVALS